jgi:hypothetical protein
VKHLILALLAATFSLPASAANTFGKIEADTGKDARTTTVKGSKSNSDNREACNFTIDQKGVKRQATEQQQKACKTANEPRSNNLREGNPSFGKPQSGEAGIAVSDPGVPSDKSTSKK